VGFEPTTRGLKVPCSAAELRARKRPYHVEIGLSQARSTCPPRRHRSHLGSHNQRTRSVLSRLRPGGCLVIGGTRWSDDDVVSATEDPQTFVVVKMLAQSEGLLVEAEVEIRDRVSWRPSLPYREVET
jgi:hypothetical protein